MCTRLVAIFFIFWLVLSINFLKAEETFNSCDENIKLIEKHSNTSSVKIINELLNDTQPQIQVACYAVMNEMVSYIDLLNDPFRLFTILLTHDNPWISGGAARALGKTGDKRAVNYLIKIIKNNHNRFVVESSVLALSDLKADEGVCVLIEKLQNEKVESSIKEAIINALVNIEGEKSIPYLLSYSKNTKLEEKDVLPKILAITAIGQYRNQEAVSALIAIFESSHNHLCKLTAAKELINSKDKSAELSISDCLDKCDDPALKQKLEKLVMRLRLNDSDSGDMILNSQD